MRIPRFARDDKRSASAGIAAEPDPAVFSFFR